MMSKIEMICNMFEHFYSRARREHDPRREGRANAGADKANKLVPNRVRIPELVDFVLRRANPPAAESEASRVEDTNKIPVDNSGGRQMGFTPTEAISIRCLVPRGPPQDKVRARLIPNCAACEYVYYKQKLTYVFADTSLAEEFEELKLAKGTEAEHRVVERHDLLDGDLSARGPVHGRANDTIRALADDIENLILCAFARIFQYDD